MRSNLASGARACLTLEMLRREGNWPMPGSAKNRPTISRFLPSTLLRRVFRRSISRLCGSTPMPFGSNSTASASLTVTRFCPSDSLTAPSRTPTVARVGRREVASLTASYTGGCSMTLVEVSGRPLDASKLDVESIILSSPLGSSREN